ncbi:MAG: hypothetical protein AB7V26_01255 [Lysobacterales bacterium]
MTTLSRQDRDQILRVELHHGMQAEELALALPRIIAACREQFTRGALIDCRSGEVLPSVETRLLLARHVAMNWPRPVVIAVLLQPELHAPDHSFAHALEKFGVRAEIFHDLDEALAWLQRAVPVGNPTPEPIPPIRNPK